MTVSILVNPVNQAIEDFVKNSMAGNTDWNDTTEKVAKKLMTGAITEEHGVPIYKFIGGKVEDRTEEEIAADVAGIPQIIPEVSTDEKIADIEDAVIEVAGIAAENEVNLEDLTDAVMELADIIGG